jgi:NitT/TauT family transport system substrate-binding protein
MQMKLQVFFINSFLITLVLVTGCAPKQPPTPALIPITVQLAWTHQAQFAGLYAADQKGYFAVEGLAVTFLEGGTSVDPFESVASGKAQFGDNGADTLLIARAAGKQVKAISVIYRRSARVFISLAASGINHPQDIVGKTISVNALGRAPFEAMMRKVGIQPDQYTLVNSTSDLSSFYSGQVQVRSVYLNNEVLTMKAAGYQLNIIYPDDYGIHNYGDVLFASDELIAAQPDLVLRFVRAALKGWTYAVENPAEIGPMVLKYYPNGDPKLEVDKMIASIPLVNTGEDHIGWMKPEIWAGMEQLLVDQGVINVPLDVTQAYTMQFLDEIYK